MKRLSALSPEANALLSKARAWRPSSEVEQRMRERLGPTLSSPSPYAAPPTRLPLASLEQPATLSFRRTWLRRVAELRPLAWGALAVALAGVGFFVGRNFQRAGLDPRVPEIPAVEVRASLALPYAEPARAAPSLPPPAPPKALRHPEGRRSFVAPRKQTATPPPVGSLADELSWLSHAESLLRQGYPSRALRWLRAHHFVSRTHEALALRAIAACQTGDAKIGQRSMQQVFRKWPHSVFSARMRAACH